MYLPIFSALLKKKKTIKKGRNIAQTRAPLGFTERQQERQSDGQGTYKC